MVHGAGNIQAIGIALQGSFGHARWIAIHAVKRFGVDVPGKRMARDARAMYRALSGRSG